MGHCERLPRVILDLLPRRVTNHHIEASGRAYVGEGDMRMQEQVLVGERCDVIQGLGWKVVAFGETSR